MTFANGAPSSAKNQSFAPTGDLAGWVDTDYSGAQFNNKNHVVNSSVPTKLYGADGTLLSSGTLQFDAHGNPIKRSITSFARDGVTATGTTEVDYTKAVFDHHRKVVSGMVTSIYTPAGGGAKTLSERVYGGSHVPVVKRLTTIAPDASIPALTSKSAYRPDGTLAEVTEQVSDRQAKVTQYAANGRTAIKTYLVDYSGTTITGNRISSGSVQLQAQGGNQWPLSKTVVSY